LGSLSLDRINALHPDITISHARSKASLELVELWTPTQMDGDKKLRQGGRQISLCNQTADHNSSPCSRGQMHIVLWETCCWNKFKHALHQYSELCGR